MKAPSATKQRIDAAYRKWSEAHPLQHAPLGWAARRAAEDMEDVARDYRQRLVELNRRERDLVSREKYIKWQETMMWADAIRDNSDIVAPQGH